MNTFEQNLKEGVVGEGAIANWLVSKGWAILPAYEKVVDDKKGPRLITAERRYVSPDMLSIKADKAIWVEAKHKTAFSWHRNTRRWVTGIDLCHYTDYCAIGDLTQWPVWILFLHKGGHAKDSPTESPMGLFGNDLSYLRKHENHRHANWGKSGMVYWALEELKGLATLSEMEDARCAKMNRGAT